MALAVAVFAGAVAGADGHLPLVPLSSGGLVLAGAFLARRRRLPWPALLCLGAGLLAAALAQRSLAGLAAPLRTGPVRAEVVLVGDPVPDGRGGVAVDVRHGDRRLRARCRGAAAASLAGRLAGERVMVVGEVRPSGPVEARLRHRHLAGRLAVDAVVGWRPGDGATRLANGLRRTLARGAEALPERQRSLLAGVTLGDDRAQPADMTEAFRAAGLTHLLAVSGQNVAFVLVVVAPVLTRLRFGPRLAATLVVLAGFALVTRAEPSVLRAVAMAAVAAVGAALGRPASSLRTLALGVAAMVLVDPLLATSLGFRLSVAGAAGIIVGAARLEAALPGPRWLVAPLSVTVAAQAAVSPLLVGTFGAVPLVSLPANLLAAPAAGPLMVWGLTGGLVAGLAGGTVARVLHLPSGLLLGWLDGVATAAAGWPLGDLGARHVAVLAAGVALIALRPARRTPAGPAGGPGSAARCPTADERVTTGGGGSDATGTAAGGSGRARRREEARPGRGGVHGVGGGARGSARPPDAAETGRPGRWWGALGAALVVGTLGVAAVAPLVSREPPPLERSLGLGATLWRGGGAAVLVLDGRARGDAVLGGLRREGVRRVDVVVARTASRSAGEVALLVARRWPRALVLVPAPGARPSTGGLPSGAVPVAAGTVLDVGGLRLQLERNRAGRLDVTVAPRSSGEVGARSGRGDPSVTAAAARGRPGSAAPGRYRGGRARTLSTGGGAPTYPPLS